MGKDNCDRGEEVEPGLLQKHGACPRTGAVFGSPVLASKGSLWCKALGPHESTQIQFHSSRGYDDGVMSWAPRGRSGRWGDRVWCGPIAGIPPCFHAHSSTATPVTRYLWGFVQSGAAIYPTTSPLR